MACLIDQQLGVPPDLLLDGQEGCRLDAAMKLRGPADDTPGADDEIGQDQNAAGLQDRLRFRGTRNVGSLSGVFAFNRPALSLPSTSGRAAEIQISQGTSTIASTAAFAPCGKSVSDRPACFSAINPATSSPLNTILFHGYRLPPPGRIPSVRETAQHVWRLPRNLARLL